MVHVSSCVDTSTRMSTGPGLISSTHQKPGCMVFDFVVYILQNGRSDDRTRYAGRQEGRPWRRGAHKERGLLERRFGEIGDKIRPLDPFRSLAFNEFKLAKQGMK